MNTLEIGSQQLPIKISGTGPVGLSMRIKRQNGRVWRHTLAGRRYSRCSSNTANPCDLLSSMTEAWDLIPSPCLIISVTLESHLNHPESSKHLQSRHHHKASYCIFAFSVGEWTRKLQEQCPSGAIQIWVIVSWIRIFPRHCTFPLAPTPLPKLKPSYDVLGKTEV